MIVIFGLTLIFTIYNILVFLIVQKRYKNWLVTVFYTFSFLVLIFRICYFSQVMRFYSLIDTLIEDIKKGPVNLQYINNFTEDIDNTVLRIGVFYLSADYTKYALGFFQLASMAELSIVIRKSVIMIKS